MTLAEDELRRDPWLMHLLDHDPERAPYRRLGAAESCAVGPAGRSHPFWAFCY